MSDDLILAVDQGTTGTTCLVVNAQGAVLARATKDFPQHYPQPGWVEHHPDELWDSVLAAMATALERSGANPAHIASIGLTNQRETSLVWRRDTGKAIHPAIVWQDGRTADRCQALRDRGAAPRIAELTGLVTDPYFSGTKLAWTLDHVEGARAAATRGELAAGTIDTYLLWRLTGGNSHATEPSNASRTMLWPLCGGGWSEELCDLLGVPRQILPQVRPSDAHFGNTLGVPGLPDGIPIHGIIGDQQAALLGQCCFSAGQAKCTYGTGAFVMLNTGAKVVPSRHGLLTSVAWQLGEQTTYCLEGSAFMAGAVVQWLRDELQIIEHAKDIEALASEVSSSEGVVFVPGHAGLGAPHWRPEARGLLRGLTRGTGRAHIARAALEGIALTVTELVEAMAADLGAPVHQLRVDGGAAANNLLMQLQSDLLGVPLQRPTVLEATALGAVALAGLGAGIWPDTHKLCEVWQLERAFTPAPDAPALATLRENWSEAVKNA